MSIENVGSAQRRRIEDDQNLPAEAPKAEAAKTKSVEDAYDRIAAPPITIPETPKSKSAAPTLAQIGAKLKATVESMKGERSDACQRSSAAKERLKADLKEAQPKLEKLAKDLEVLGKKAGPAGKDILELAKGIYHVAAAIHGFVEGAAAAETGLGEVEAGMAFLELVEGSHELKHSLEHLPHDWDKAKTAGPELAAVKRDLKDLEPTLQKIDHDARDAAGLVTHFCVAG